MKGTMWIVTCHNMCRNVSDETEVIWTDIDEALNLPKNKSCF